MSKSLCSPLGAQSAVGLPYCRELMVSLARYFPLLFQSEEGRVVGLVDEEREERKFGVESSVRVPPGHGCLLCHPAEIGPAGSGTRQPRSSAGLPSQRRCGRWWISNNTGLPLSPELCLSWPASPLTPLRFHYCIPCAI